MQIRGTSIPVVSVALLAVALPLQVVFAHEEHGHVAPDMDGMIPSSNGPHAFPTPGTMGSRPSSYFEYPTESHLLWAHVFFMVLGWVFVLPVAVMLNISRSRLRTIFQILFFAINGLGVLLGTVYNARTPDLYPNNAHHKLGWALTWIMGGQLLIGILSFDSTRWKKSGTETEERTSLIPVSIEALEAHSGMAHGDDARRRQSNDSGQGTERASSSLRSLSLSPVYEGNRRQFPRISGTYGRVDDVPDIEKQQSSRGQVLGRLLRQAPNLSKRIFCVVVTLSLIVDRTILVLGFVSICTGVVTYVGIMRGNGIFNGLAHFVKGGIFFWYGVLTLGRWIGCFADLGWAWNIKPARDVVGSWKTSLPSAEFTESFVIFLYGSTNVFLEHLAAWGGAWTAQDLEHVSISIMFFGGGLCGMLVESVRIRNLLNTNILIRSEKQLGLSSIDITDSGRSRLLPKSYRVSMNPIPGLVILLLGSMMGSHHQSSMVSTMIHKQWGTLLVGFALARGVTYLVLFLSPPISVLPSRPPSELIASFCLICGGLVFMASTKDIVAAMEKYDLDAMFVFTVTVGFTAFFMAWIIFVVAVKGWATQRERRPDLYRTQRSISVLF